MSSRVIKWGILGCGKIARKFAADLQLVEGAELTALGARDLAQAQQFARDYPARYLHGSYESLLRNDEVEVIYVATPHGLHHEQVLMCLDYGKSVLCEKALALNSRQVHEMISKAREKNLFLMEALWTKFLPHYHTVMALLRDGRLGEVRSMTSTFGFRASDPAPARVYDPALGGGSILDIGIYNIFMTMAVLGRPDHIEATMTPATTGVDAQCSMVFKYDYGAIAQLLSSFLVQLPTEAWIAGTQGALRLTSRFYEPSTTIEYYPEKMDSREVIPFLKESGWGYRYQLDHVCACLRAGATESPVMSLADSLVLMEVMDEVRAKAGVRYAVD